MDQDYADILNDFAQRLVRAESELRALKQQRPADLDNPRFRVFLAKQGASSKQFQEQQSSAGVLIDGDTTLDRHCTSDTVFGQLRDDPDGFAVIEMPDPNGGTPGRAFYKISGASLIPCEIDSTAAGAEGSTSSMASWTYVVNDLAGNEIGNNIAVLRTATVYGTLAPWVAAGTGTRAWGVWISSVFYLVILGERLKTNACASGIDSVEFAGF